MVLQETVNCWIFYKSVAQSHKETRYGNQMSSYILYHSMLRLFRKQLIDVISSFYADKGSQRAIFTAITKGLTSSSANLIDAVKQTLLDRSNYFSATENFWCIRYYLLCLYGTDFTIAEQNMKQNIDLYYHFSIFRLLELQVIKEYSKSDQKYFIACIEGEKEMISPIFKRWLVIFNKFLIVTC